MDEKVSDPKPTPSKTAAEKPPVKEKHSRAFSFVSMLFLLALLAAGVMTYLWYNQKTQVDSLNADLRSLKSTETSLRSQIDKLKKQNANLGNAVVDQVANGDESLSDAEQIKKLVVAHEHARVAAVDAQYTVGEPSIQGDFAKVGMSSPDGPGWRCLVKKVDGMWVILACGQQDPAENDLKAWGVPAGFLNS